MKRNVNIPLVPILLIVGASIVAVSLFMNRKSHAAPKKSGISNSSFVSAKITESEYKNRIAEWGTEVKQIQGDRSEDKTVAILTDTNNKISKKDVDLVIANNKACGINESFDDALKFVLKERILYNVAIKKGFSMSSAEIENKVKENKEWTRQASNYSDFLLYLKNSGETEDSYWNSQKDSFKYTETIHKWADSLRKSNSKFNDEKTWKDYYTKYCDSLIKNTKVKYIK